MSEQFNEKTMLEVIKADLEDGYTSLEDIQQDTENSYWIIGTYKANQALEEFDSEDELAYDTTLDGVFGAIQYAHSFYDELGAQLDSDRLDPENIANVIALVNMQFTINDILNHFDYDFDADDELTDKQVQSIKNLTTDDLQN